MVSVNHRGCASYNQGLPPGRHTPKRVVSLQPSATVTLRDIGLIDRLVACTKYCAEACGEIRDASVPRVRPPSGLTRAPLIISDSWTAQAQEILAAKPELVLASVPYQLDAVAEILRAGVRFLGLAPRTMDEIYADIAAIAGVMGVPDKGEEVIAIMQARIAEVRRVVAGAPQLRVFSEEWGKPIIASQPWIAELVEAAGGVFISEPGKRTTENAVTAANPDVILAAWCGAGDRVPLKKIVQQRGWEKLNAVRDGRVFCVRDELFNTPASTLIGGLNAIAWALHPERFERPEGIRQMEAGF